MAEQEMPSVFDDVSQQIRTNYMGFASFTILVWDHIVTFSDEVEYIWKAKRSLMVYLFLINRYLTPLGFIVNLFAYLSPVWTPEVCNEFIRFEGSMTVIGISIVAIMMFLRIKALYHAQRFVVWAVAFLWFFQTGIQAYLLTRGEAVVHNEDSGVRACTMIFDPEISILASSSAWLPLLYDTIIFGLTLYRTFPSIRHRNAPFVMKRLLEDGLIYYIAILAVTLVLTIMIIAAPPGLKNITAQLELLITVAMMSRITLNLKKSVRKVLMDDKIRAELPSMFTRKSHWSVDPTIQFRSPAFNETVNGATDSIMMTGVPSSHGGGDDEERRYNSSRLSTITETNVGQAEGSSQQNQGYTTIGPITIVEMPRKKRRDAEDQGLRGADGSTEE